MNITLSAKDPKWLEDINKAPLEPIKPAFKLQKANSFKSQKRKISDKELKNLEKICQKPQNLKANQDAKIIQLLGILHSRCGFSIVIKDEQSKNILSQSAWGVSIANSNLEKILDTLISKNNLYYEFKDGVLEIASMQSKIFKLDYIAATREGQTITRGGVDVSPEIIGKYSKNSDKGDINNEENLIKVSEKFDFWKDIKTSLEEILNIPDKKITLEAKEPKPSLVINEQSGIIYINAKPDKIKQAQEFLSNIDDRLGKQISIEIAIISVELSNERSRGIDWSKFELSFDGYIRGLSSYSSEQRVGNNAINAGASANFSINGLLNFLNSTGRTKVISRPHIVTLNNQQAIISVGENINYRVPETTEYDNNSSYRSKTTYNQYSLFVGVLLNLTPQISDNNEVSIRINPSLSSLKEVQKGQEIKEIAPDTIQKKLSTVIKAKSGESVIIGGLIGESELDSESSVPFLSKLPILGSLFGYEKNNKIRTELVFVITPKIIAPLNERKQDRF
ncbi:pilus (MSHA type) biogenesis protein MshL [Campylobacter sp. 19-13652]|uniref:pilus (MSHA type) biogenesis protein MshL n=1 Tax=Campylobacter sp. 19-13652 TaxID=2840180 RepID=UPI001C8561C8|nr:pilus (MSHA type) biogenesis protein MshL [Campylobacter sp. 19-13652]